MHQRFNKVGILILLWLVHFVAGTPSCTTINDHPWALGTHERACCPGLKACVVAGEEVTSNLTADDLLSFTCKPCEFLGCTHHGECQTETNGQSHYGVTTEWSGVIVFILLSILVCIGVHWIYKSCINIDKSNQNSTGETPKAIAISPSGQKKETTGRDPESNPEPLILEEKEIMLQVNSFDNRLRHYPVDIHIEGIYVLGTDGEDESKQLEEMDQSVSTAPSVIIEHPEFEKYNEFIPLASKATCQYMKKFINGEHEDTNEESSPRIETDDEYSTNELLEIQLFGSDRKHQSVCIDNDDSDEQEGNETNGVHDGVHSVEGNDTFYTMPTTSRKDTSTFCATNMKIHDDTQSEEHRDVMFLQYPSPLANDLGDTQTFEFDFPLLELPTIEGLYALGTDVEEEEEKCAELLPPTSRCSRPEPITDPVDYLAVLYSQSRHQRDIIPVLNYFDTHLDADNEADDGSSSEREILMTTDWDVSLELETKMNYPCHHDEGSVATHPQEGGRTNAGNTPPRLPGGQSCRGRDTQGQPPPAPVVTATYQSVLDDLAFPVDIHIEGIYVMGTDGEGDESGVEEDHIGPRLTTEFLSASTLESPKLNHDLIWIQEQSTVL